MIMSEKILSVIIPSYNSRPYLDKCLGSLVVPDIMDKLDVIVVNDGSTDGSESICDDYIVKYPDSFSLINKENGGHGSAINAGAEKARGRYMKVLDADDWFLTESIPEFVSRLESAQADVVLTCHHTINISLKVIFGITLMRMERDLNFMRQSIKHIGTLLQQGAIGGEDRDETLGLCHLHKLWELRVKEWFAHEMEI